MPDDLEFTLRDGVQLIKQNMSQENRLDAVGLNHIVDLLAQGHELYTRPSAKEPGILNTLNVHEHKFFSWLLKRPSEEQDLFYRVIQIQKNRIKEDIISRSVGTLDDFDNLVDDVAHHRTTVKEAKDVAIILDKKQQASTKILQQLANLDKLSQGDSRKQLSQTTGKIEVHVHAAEEQMERLKKLRELKK